MKQSAGLLALAMGTFALGLAEFSMMGILSPLARDMGVNIAQAGDFISAYALGVCAGAPLPLFFRSRPYKFILTGLAAVIVLGNLAAALSEGYYTLLLSRFIAGLPHGAFFGVGAIVAATLAEPGRKATAVAIMVMGMTVANLVGVPCATWLTNTLSWRATFFIVSVAGALTVAGIYFFVPLKEHDSPKKLSRAFMFLRAPAPWLIFMATFLGQGSLYCWYSYMEPIMLNVAHIPADGMKWVMVVAGLGMVIGNMTSGKLADHFHPALVTCGVAVLIIPILCLIYFCSSYTWFAIFLTFMGAGCLFALGGPMQYLIVRFSRGGEVLGGAGIQIAFNSSNAFSAFIGGMAINAGLGLTSPALFGIPMAAATVCILVWFYRRYRNVKL